MKMNKKICIALLVSGFLTQNFIFAKGFNLTEEIKKCQKCHGVKFNKEVLHSTKRISTFSKKELLQAFKNYDKAPVGGKKGLMKLIVKRYDSKQRNAIANYIVSTNKK